MKKLKQHTVANAIASVLCMALIVGTINLVVAYYRTNMNRADIHALTTKLSPTAASRLPNPVGLPQGNDWTQYRFDIYGTGANPERSISALNVNQLAQRWEIEHFAAFESTPAIVEGIIYVTNGNSLYAFNLRTGK